jgi:hypothetical protein
MKDFEELQKEIDAVLEAAGMPRLLAVESRLALKRYRATSDDSDSSISSDDSSDLDCSYSASTVMTSVTSAHISGRSTSPQSFLLSIPPAHSLPREHQPTYAFHLAKLTAIASRINSIKKLNAKYEREEGKRRWLEGLERGRLGDRALRRAFSNGQLKGLCASAEPLRGSKLFRSWTAEDEERVNVPRPDMMLSVMMEDDSMDEHDSDADMSSEDECHGPVTPRGFTHDESINIRVAPTAMDVDVAEVFGVHHAEEITAKDVTIFQVRPDLNRTGSASSFSDLDSEFDAPSLTSCTSDDSIASEWDDDLEEALAPTPKLLPAPVFSAPLKWTTAAAPALPSKPKHRAIDWTREATMDDVMA